MASYKGLYKVKNSSKYKGDVKNVIYRSLLERSYMVKLDNADNVLQWSSEEIIIPYMSPLDNRMHRYFMDFYVKYKEKDGTIKEILVEIKPDSQTRPPKEPSRKTKRYFRQVTTWLVNEAKWNAADAYCKKNGLEFKIITEKELRPYGNKKRK